MAQPSTDDLKERDSQSTVINKSTIRVNGVPVKEVISTKTITGELVYRDNKWKQQEEEIETIINK